MRIQTQLLKIFFAAVLIVLATLTIVTAPAQMMDAGQSSKPSFVAMLSDVRVLTPGSSLFFLPA